MPRDEKHLAKIKKKHTHIHMHPKFVCKVWNCRYHELSLRKKRQIRSQQNDVF